MRWTWSAWAWVYSTAWRRETPAATSCRRSSGGVSIRMRRPPDSINAAVRVRRSRGSVDVHVRQEHPTWGTPKDVPVPRKVSRTSHFLDLDQVGAARHLPRHAARHDDAVAPLAVAALQ